MGGQSHASASAQDLGGVAPRRAPGVQGEGEQTQAQVQADDEDGGVAAGQVEAVDQIQCRQEEEKNKAAEENAGDDVLWDGEKRVLEVKTRNLLQTAVSFHSVHFRTRGV